MSEIAKAVVIVDGSVASLVGAWREMLRVTAGFAGGVGSGVGAGRGEEGPGVAQYLVGFVPAGLSDGQRSAAARIVEMCGMSRVLAGGLVRGSEVAKEERGPNVGLALRGLDATEMLLGAGALAMERGMERVVWPVCLGKLACGHLMAGGEEAGTRRVELLSEVFDRGLLVGRLLSIDVGAGKRGVTVQTPLLELSDEQLVDLAADLDAPVMRAWWRQEDHAAWRGLLGACGLLKEGTASSGAANASGNWIEGKPQQMVADQVG